MLSFALVFLFLGSMYRGMEKPRFNMLFVANCVLLMALALSHIVTTIILVLVVPGLLLPHILSSRQEGERLGLSEMGLLAAIVGSCSASWRTSARLSGHGRGWGGPLGGAHCGSVLAYHQTPLEHRRARRGLPACCGDHRLLVGDSRRHVGTSTILLDCWSQRGLPGWPFLLGSSWLWSWLLSSTLSRGVARSSDKQARPGLPGGGGGGRASAWWPSGRCRSPPISPGRPT